MQRGKDTQPAGSEPPSFVARNPQVEEFDDPGLLMDPFDEWTNGSIMDSWWLHDDFRWINGVDIQGLEVDPSVIKEM